MFFTVLGSASGMMLISWFVYQYQHEDRAFSNQELAVMSAKLMNDAKVLHRASKTVLTAEEIKKMDPTFVPPVINGYGEPDI